MLEKLESPPNVIAIKAVGKLAKDDYTNVLTPAVKALMESTGELRAVIVVGDEFEGMTPGGTWEDLKTGLQHFTKWKRCAVVSDKDWVKHGVALFGWTMPGEVTVFSENEVGPAIEWAAAE
jgi:hypothetical protein